MKQRVLLIDDDKAYGQSLARNFMVYTSYSMKHVEDSTRWREEMSQYRPDFVLIDLNMPKLNGVEVAEAIRKDREFANTKILLVTAMRLKSENEENGETYQGFDCLSKDGLEVEALAQRIASSLNKMNQRKH